jgi:hypothetical protein
LDTHEGDGRTELRLIFGKFVVEAGNKQKLIRIVSNGGL